MSETSRINLLLRREAQGSFRTTKRTLPVVLVTGFLGSGKTTLVEHLLAQVRGVRMAALVNDLKDHVDFHTLSLAAAQRQTLRHEASADAVGGAARKAATRGRRGAAGVRELSDGCSCCSLLPDLKSSVAHLLKSPGSASTSRAAPDGDVEYVLVETSGVTQPARIVTLLDERFGKMTRVRLDAVVAVVDADVLFAGLTHGTKQGGGGVGRDRRRRRRRRRRQEGDHKVGEDAAGTAKPLVPATLLAQLACADIVVLNKTDLLVDADATSGSVSEGSDTSDDSPDDGNRGAKLELLRAWLRTQGAPHAVVYDCAYGRVPPPLIMGLTSLGTDNTGVLTHEFAPVCYTVAPPKKFPGDAPRQRAAVVGPHRRDGSLALASKRGSASAAAAATEAEGEGASHSHLMAGNFWSFIARLPASSPRVVHWRVQDLLAALLLPPPPTASASDARKKRGTDDEPEATGAVLRIKGTVLMVADADADAGAGGVRHVLQLSGRGRLSLEEQGTWGTTNTPAETRLVFIGHGALPPSTLARLRMLTAEDLSGGQTKEATAAAAAAETLGDAAPRDNEAERVLTRALLACGSDVELAAASLPPPPPKPAQSKAMRSADALRKLVAKDGRFTVLSVAEPTRVVFRLVGGRFAGGLSLEQLRLRHGIDLDDANVQLCREINSRRGALLAAAQLTEQKTDAAGADGGGAAAAASSVVACGLAPGTVLTPEAAWETLSAAANSVLRVVFKHVRACRCDNHG